MSAASAHSTRTQPIGNSRPPSSAAAGGDKKETIRLESFSLPIIVGVAAAAAAAVVVVACVTSPEGERDVSVVGGG